MLAQLGWLWTWIWTVPNPEKLNWWKGAKALPIFALFIGGLMLAHAMGSILSGDWSHGQSYVMTLPWAHRNIAMESLFLMTVIGAHFSKKRWLWWWGFITVLALVYQVRSVLLGSAIWMIYSLWNQGRHAVWVKRGFLAACALFVAGQLAWNTLPAETRIREFAKVPDIVKSLDVVYNVKAAESSSIRLNLWSWTLDNSQPLGAGLGAWRNDAEGWTNVAVGRCGEALHRAHSEILQWGYEIGWLPLLLLIGLCWPLRRSLGRWALFIFALYRLHLSGRARRNSLADGDPGLDVQAPASNRRGSATGVATIDYCRLWCHCAAFGKLGDGPECTGQNLQGARGAQGELDALGRIVHRGCTHKTSR